MIPSVLHTHLNWNSTLIGNFTMSYGHNSNNNVLRSENILIFRILVDITWMNVLRVWHEVFVAEEMIRELFGRCGEMLTVRLNNKKFCHIRFIHEASVDAALFFSGNSSFYPSCLSLVEHGFILTSNFYSCLKVGFTFLYEFNYFLFAYSLIQKLCLVLFH